jgi:hypothetical protein
MARGESLNLVAYRVQRLQLGGEVNSSRSLRGPSDIEAGDTDGVTSGDHPVFLLVIKNPREHAIKMLRSVKAMFHILKLISLWESAIV